MQFIGVAMSTNLVCFGFYIFQIIYSRWKPKTEIFHNLNFWFDNIRNKSQTYYLTCKDYNSTLPPIRERKTERQTDRQAGREKETDRQRQRDRQRNISLPFNSSNVRYCQIRFKNTWWEHKHRRCDPRTAHPIWVVQILRVSQSIARYEQ